MAPPDQEKVEVGEIAISKASGHNYAKKAAWAAHEANFEKPAK